MPPKQTHQKLELTWIGKGEEPKLELRILIENPEYSYGDPTTENMLIHGDNLLALKALEQDFAGKIKCIYIDPPYNTGSAFEHYDDGVEHSMWLNLITPRLKVLHNLLSKDGSIWMSIDDNEAHYLKVLCDDIFGRKNFVATIIWEKRKSRENRRAFSFKHDYILVFAKDKYLFEAVRNPIAINEEVLSRYKNPDNDVRGIWQSVAITAQAGHATASQFYQITTPSGRKLEPPAGNCWRFTENKLNELIADNRIYFGPNGNNVPRQKKFLQESEDAGLTPETIWYADNVGTNDTAKRHSNILFNGEGFANPKPEELIEQVLHIASNPGDLILDSFLGSGTTAAVAHKMGRRYIGTELGEHAKTHCYPRLKQVVDGEQGGISKAVNWQDGGGFKFYTLAPSLLNQDKYGNWVITKEYNAQMLAAAMAKQEGFSYAPNEHKYWKQGASSEQDFIFTTTQFLTVESLDQVHDEMKEGESLLICCKAFQKECKGKYPNITIKKIPQMLLGRCEYGREDYSLNIVNMPVEEKKEESAENISVQELSDTGSKKKPKNQQSLF